MASGPFCRHLPLTCLGPSAGTWEPNFDLCDTALLDSHPLLLLLLPAWKRHALGVSAGALEPSLSTLPPLETLSFQRWAGCSWLCSISLSILKPQSFRDSVLSKTGWLLLTLPCLLVHPQAPIPQKNIKNIFVAAVVQSSATSRSYRSCQSTRFKETLDRGFPGGSADKESAWSAGDLGSIPELERSPGERKGCPLQYSGLENSMDCIVNGVAKSWTWLSDFHFTIIESGELESSFLQIEATANHLFYVCFIVCLV